MIDCDGTGGAFKINSVRQAVISGFDVRNAVGSTENGGFAGGVDAKNTRNISVLSSTFRNCTGKEAGAIAVHTTGSCCSSDNTRNFQNLTISYCSGAM